ncbi:TPA: restriction endonuclease [archaeon]|nr:restriction endonuclease [Candidatus Naiadarchaeales archaeon SRR2090153.bin461]
MDVNTLLDFAEQLLEMYGYETRRNVGLAGGRIVTAPLEKETGLLGEELPKTSEKEIVYRVDLLAEKKDIERPFGRIVAGYKRGSGPVEPADVRLLAKTAEFAEAYSAIMLTTTGYTAEAQSVAVQLGIVTIMTPEKIESLLGKAMTKEKWWFNSPAFPIRFKYNDAVDKLKWFFEKMMFQNFECIWFYNKELAYEPYWKFAYHIAPKKGHREMKEGSFALNAMTGEIDTWVDIKPEFAVARTDKPKTLKESYFGEEAIHNVETMVGRTKIKKPKLPPDVHFQVYRPAMAKHEAKLAAMQWISYVEGVKPEDIVITGRELVYYPWWKFYYFYRPVVKNAWGDTEKMQIKMSAVYGDIFNQWKNYLYIRDIIFYFMERSLLKILGRDRYVTTMRKVTQNIATLWWNYHLVIKPGYIWALLLAITMLAIYAFITATVGLSIVIGILLIMIFMGPGYAFLYLLQDYLKRFPSPSYVHPNLTEKEYESKIKPVEEAKEAMAELQELEEKGKLTPKEKKELEKIQKKKFDELVKKAKKKPSWF